MEWGSDGVMEWGSDGVMEGGEGVDRVGDWREKGTTGGNRDPLSSPVSSTG